MLLNIFNFRHESIISTILECCIIIPIPQLISVYDIESIETEVYLSSTN